MVLFKSSSFRRSFFSFSFIILTFQFLYSQENHYWIQQHGPTSTFLAGAVTGGVRDNSSLFYNPGAAAFTEGFNLSLQSDAIFYEGDVRRYFWGVVKR